AGTRPAKRTGQPPRRNAPKGARNHGDSSCSAVENDNGSREPLKRQAHSRASAARGEALLVARRASQGAGEGETKAILSLHHWLGREEREGFSRARKRDSAREPHQNARRRYLWPAELCRAVERARTLTTFRRRRTHTRTRGGAT